MASPFFIVGSGRCGSTWLYEVLRHHPGLALTNEAHVLDLLYRCNLLAATPRTEIVDLHTRDNVHMRGIVHEDHVEAFAPVFSEHGKAICEDYYRRAFADKDFRYWGDKLPDPRAAVTAKWVWDDVRYLVLVRDPRDVLCSWRAHAQRQHVADSFPELLELTAEKQGRSWAAIYGGFQEELPGAMTLRYEDLRQEPEKHIRAILEDLDLGWCDEVAHALVNNKSFRSHGTSKTLEASSGRWQRELDDEDRAVLEHACGELMRGFGYL